MPAPDIFLGDSTFQASQNYGAGGLPWGMAIGDFNGDAYPDLALPDHVSPGSVTVLMNAADWSGHGALLATQANVNQSMLTGPPLKTRYTSCTPVRPLIETPCCW